VTKPSSGHRPGVCQQCGGVTGSVRAVRCVACYRTRGQELGSKRSGQQTDGMTIDGDTAELVLTVQEPIKTLADLIRICEIDTDEWEIVSWKANKWDTSAKDETTQKIVTRPLFQVTATMRRRVDFQRAKQEIERLKADAKARIKPQPAPKRIRPAGKHMLELNIPDLHIGKLAWSEETLGANYDHRIAVELYKEAVDTLLQRTAAFTVDRVVIPFGNDFLNSDTKAGTTTAGTPLDNDSRYQKVYVEGRKLLVWVIERARAIAPHVDVLSVPGNHDTLSTFTLGDSLECWYHHTKGVTVHNGAALRKYTEHGRVMLMFTHGNRGKLQDYPLLMATEQPEMFGRTRYREAHTGDKHQLRVQEHRGVRVRILSALCPADAWHSEYQFVGNQRAAEAYVWHPDEGLVSVAVFTVQEQAA